MNNNCITGKRGFVNDELAIEALIQNHIINEHLTGQGPSNVYQCLECGEWHFTSQGRSEVLDTPKIIERIRKERLANHWERKLKK